MRHLSRIHSVTLDWLLNRINLEPKIQIKYVDTELADIPTKGSFTLDDWNHLLRLFNTMSFSMFFCSCFSYFFCDPMGKQSAMSKRSQEASSSEFSPVAKPKPMIPAKLKPMNLELHNRLSAGKNPSARSQRIFFVTHPKFVRIKCEMQRDHGGERSAGASQARQSATLPRPVRVFA